MPPPAPSAPPLSLLGNDKDDVPLSLPKQRLAEVPSGQPLPAQHEEDEGEEVWDESVDAVQAQAAVLAPVRQAKAAERLTEEQVLQKLCKTRCSNRTAHAQASTSKACSSSSSSSSSDSNSESDNGSD